MRVAPTLVTPTDLTSSSPSRLRTPPAALICIASETEALISFRSSIVAPVGAKPVEVLTKSAPADFGQLGASHFLVIGQVGVLENDLHQRLPRPPRPRP